MGMRLSRDTGEWIEIHSASQTIFAGQPASVEDPDTGEIEQYNHDAIPPLYSGPRYISHVILFIWN